MVTIPASLWQRLNIELDAKLRRDTDDDDGNRSVEVVKQRHGAFDDLEPVPMSGDGSETYDLAGYENDPTFSGHN